MINKFLHPNGGSETYIFKLGEYLMSQGHEVQYFGMEHEGRCVGNRVNVYTGISSTAAHKVSFIAIPSNLVKTSDSTSLSVATVSPSVYSSSSLPIGRSKLDIPSASKFVLIALSLLSLTPRASLISKLQGSLPYCFLKS